MKSTRTIALCENDTCTRTGARVGKDGLRLCPDCRAMRKASLMSHYPERGTRWVNSFGRKCQVAYNCPAAGKVLVITNPGEKFVERRTMYTLAEALDSIRKGTPWPA